MTPSEVEQLGQRGWFSREGFAGACEAAPIARQRAEAGLYAAAGVARAHRQDASVRSDRVLWVSQADPQLSGLQAGFEALRLELNLDAWLGLTRFDLQLAHYPGAGARYVRHRDAFEGSADHRRVTAIVYLNEGWVPAHGGELRLHTVPEAQLEPSLGRAVIFLSAKVEHEVLPAWAPRFAATAWYYGD